MHSRHTNKTISFYPRSLRPFLRILCVVDDSRISVLIHENMQNEFLVRFQLYHIAHIDILWLIYIIYIFLIVRRTVIAYFIPEFPGTRPPRQTKTSPLRPLSLKVLYL